MTSIEDAESGYPYQDFPWQLFQDVNKLTQEWNRIAQELSTVYIPSWPTVLTAKPFKAHWHRSANLMMIICQFTSFWPGQPTVDGRLEGTQAQYVLVRSFITFATRFITPKQKSLYGNLREELPRMTPQEQHNRMTELWQDTLFLGGVLFSSRECCFGVWVGHLSFLTSIKYKNEKMFAIADPEVSAYKLMTFQHMISLCIDPVICCDLV